MKKKVSILLIVLLAALFIVPATASANAAEPPTLILILKNAPEDISVAVVSGDELKEGRKSRTAWETYFTFYKWILDRNDTITLRVSGNGKSYDQTIGSQYLTGYNNIITLDFNALTIADGKLLPRSILLVTLRVLLTLAIEGVIFFLFGFRTKRSWLVFLLMNLLTQGILNILINGLSPFASYVVFNLIFMEFWVFIAEIIGALLFIKEQNKFRRVMCMLAANMSSLVLGGYLITRLPI